jgi:hypothetical protein
MDSRGGKMIFDWIKNSEAVIRDRRLSDSDDWEARRRWMQECAAIRHARHSLGWDEGECRRFWGGISNGLAATFSYDESELDRTWEELWEAAGRLGPLKPLPEIAVTDGDLAFLNSLEAPLWVRRYWLCLLVWIRTERALRGAAEYDGYVNAWLIRKAAPGKSVGNAEKSISRWSQRCGRPFPLKAMPSGKGIKAVYALGEKSGGGVAARVSMDGLEDALSLLSGEAFVCKRCGERFDSDRLRRSGLCERCGVKARLESNREAHRKYDGKKNRS